MFLSRPVYPHNSCCSLSRFSNSITISTAFTPTRPPWDFASSQASSEPPCRLLVYFLCFRFTGIESTPNLTHHGAFRCLQNSWLHFFGSLSAAATTFGKSNSSSPPPLGFPSAKYPISFFASRPMCVPLRFLSGAPRAPRPLACMGLLVGDAWRRTRWILQCATCTKLHGHCYVLRCRPRELGAIDGIVSESDV